MSVINRSSLLLVVSVAVILGMGFAFYDSSVGSPTGKFYQNVEGQEPSFEESYRQYQPSEEERMRYESQKEEYQPADEERARYETKRENYEPTAEELARREEMRKKYESMSEEDRRKEFERYGPSEEEMKTMKAEMEKRRGFFSRWFGGSDKDHRRSVIGKIQFVNAKPENVAVNNRNLVKRPFRRGLDDDFVDGRQMVLDSFDQVINKRGVFQTGSKLSDIVLGNVEQGFLPLVEIPLIQTLHRDGPRQMTIGHYALAF